MLPATSVKERNIKIVLNDISKVWKKYLKQISYFLLIQL